MANREEEINPDKPLLTMKDRERLAPVIRGEYPSESAYAEIETILREHLGRALHRVL